MAQVVCSAPVLATLEQVVESDANAAHPIASAFESLGAHPFVGRRVEDELRELVISYGATGYIALYRFDVQRDEVRILALRHQREIGYLP